MIADCGQRLTVEFITERCENCSCAKTLVSPSPSVTIELPKAERVATDSNALSPRLDAGQAVELRVPGRSLLLCAGVLFGVPLLLAFVAGVVSDLVNFSAATQALCIFGGFVLGGLASYRLRSLLQSNIYSGISITTLDC